MRSAATLLADIVFARSAGTEAVYCAGVLTFDWGFHGFVVFPNEVYHRAFENQPAAEAVGIGVVVGLRWPARFWPGYTGRSSVPGVAPSK